MAERERCSMPTLAPADWARAAFHDGLCKRRGVESVNGEMYCKQHAAILRRMNQDQHTDQGAN